MSMRARAFSTDAPIDRHLHTRIRILSRCICSRKPVFLQIIDVYFRYISSGEEEEVSEEDEDEEEYDDAGDDEEANGVEGD